MTTTKQGPTGATPGEARARAAVYGFLADAFSARPDRHSIRALDEMASAVGIEFPSNLSVAELEREYLDLWVIPNPRYIAPYESVFRDQWLLPAVLRRGSDPSEGGPTVKGLVMGESTVAVRQCYLGAGVLPEDDLPDHIANELRFLAYLCAREAEAPAEERAAPAECRADFCRRHILKWLSQLRDKVSARERLGYYSAALRVLEELLQAD